MWHREEKKIEDLLNELIEAYGMRKKLSESDLRLSWAPVMGEEVAGQTLQLYVKDNKLFVKLKSAALRNDLQYRKSEIMQKFIDYHGKRIVEDIIFLA